jgi:F-type H+-transporting ATPase subunit epsilon
MARKSFECTIVTPTASVISGQVVYATVPAWDGQIGFLPGRAPILSRLGTGNIRLDFADTAKGKGGTYRFRVEGGFFQMADDRLTILAEKAVPVENQDD